MVSASSAPRAQHNHEKSSTLDLVQAMKKSQKEPCIRTEKFEDLEQLKKAPESVVGAPRSATQGGVGTAGSSAACAASLPSTP